MSQPLKMVPITSNTPIIASSVPAWVPLMPWSWAAEMKCVCTSPVVESPHTAKLPHSNQNVPDRHALRSASNAAVTGLPTIAGGGVHPSAAP